MNLASFGEQVLAAVIHLSPRLRIIWPRQAPVELEIWSTPGGYGPARLLPAVGRNRFPRFRRVHSGAYHWRHGRKQSVGSALVTVSTFAVAMVVMLTINAMGLLRVSAEGEMHGLDLHEHGISAYPEYVISAMGRPGGMPADQPAHFSTTAPLPQMGLGHKTS